MVSLLTLSAASYGQGRITDVSFSRTNEGIDVAIRGEHLSAPKQTWAWKGKTLVLEFAAKLTEPKSKVPVYVNGIDSLKVVWTSSKPPRAAVAIRMIDAKLEPTIKATPTGYLVSFPAPTGLAMTPSSTMMAMPKPQIEAQPMVTMTPTQMATQLTNAITETFSLTSPMGSTKTATSAMTAADGMAFLDTPPAARTNAHKMPTRVKKMLGEGQPVPQPRTVKSTPIRASKTLPIPTAFTGPVRQQAGRVSLDFVNTEVVQILKALSIQANADIVTAPDIKGTLTVALTNVTVEEALDFITSLSGLRYAKIGKAYVVAPRDKFTEIMSGFQKGGGQGNETRLVPIFSGEPAQIKATVNRAFTAESSRGAFEILLPGESAGARKSAEPAAKPEPNPAGDAGAPQAGGANPAPATKSSGSGGGLYVMLVGQHAMLDQVERLVKLVDESICNAMGIEIPADSSVVQESYVLNSDSISAKTLIEAVSNMDGSLFKNVELYPSPGTSEQQSILIVGRRTAVDRAKKLLGEFDGSGGTLYVYDVKYLDPRSLREGVAAFVPGLRATLPPGAASNPRLYTPGVTTRNSAQVDLDNQGQGGGAGRGASNAERPTDASAKGDKGQVEGLAQPFNEFERVAQPMKLILRGTADQIQRGLTYLAKVDVAPRQLALDLRVLEMTREDALRVGLDWSVFSGGVVRSLRMNQTLGDTAASGGTISGDFRNRANNASGGSVLATLDSINDKRKILSRPNLIAIDGRETELFVGDVIRYIESIQASQNGTTVTTGEVRVGVRLAVLPRIGGDGKIMMDLRPVVSFLRGFTAVPGGGSLPQTSERVAQSTVQINSGETIAIGGLIQDSDRKSFKGIPILKDIPLIGQLFGRTDNDRIRTEIVFFLTAREVSDADRKAAADPIQRDAEENPKPEKPKK